jgi:hypothetical protein
VSFMADAMQTFPGPVSRRPLAYPEWKAICKPGSPLMSQFTAVGEYAQHSRTCNG